MAMQTTPYPVRTVSRSVARRAARRLSWFVMGTGFGVGCALSLTNALTPSNMPYSWDTARHASDLSMNFAEASLEKGFESGKAASGMHVSALALPDQQVKPVEMDTASRFAQHVNDTQAAQESLEALVEEEANRKNYPLIVDMKVGTGDTLMTILTDTGVSYNEAQKAVSSMGKLYNPKRLNVGQNVSLVLDKPDEEADLVISSMVLPVDALSKVKVTRDDDDLFKATTIKTKVTPKLVHAGGRINSSLYETAISSGVPAGTLAELINAYSYDVDFQRDVHAGDHVELLFEKMITEEGRVVGNGKIVYAELEVGKRELEIYHFTDSSGFSDYYNSKGESVRKALLRTPVNGARITSKFGMRHHPILGYSKMHKGIDFGASRGTPIYAAGDGKITRAGRNGGYGNYLQIKHEGKYSTAYAHIQKFAKNIKVGTRVKQGQIVAYVGTTGRSTGPHLHYEVLANGKQVNPAGIKFKTGKVLAGKELAAFNKTKAQIMAQLKDTPAENTSMAMAQ